MLGMQAIRPEELPTNEYSESQLFLNHPIYRVDNKKVFHKSEGKMPQKMKITLQRAENLVHVKQHYVVPFCKKIFLSF